MRRLENNNIVIGGETETIATELVTVHSRAQQGELKYHRDMQSGSQPYPLPLPIMAPFDNRTATVMGYWLVYCFPSTARNARGATWPNLCKVETE